MDKKSKQNLSSQRGDRQSSILSFFSPKPGVKKEASNFLQDTSTPVPKNKSSRLDDILMSEDKDIERELLNSELSFGGQKLESINRDSSRRLRDLEMLSADGNATTCETTPCKSKNLKSDKFGVETTGRRIRRICDSDEELNSDSEVLSRRIKRRFNDDGLEDNNNERSDLPASQMDGDISNFGYDIKDDEVLEAEMAAKIEEKIPSDFTDLGKSLPKSRRKETEMKFQEGGDSVINADEELGKELLGTAAAQSSLLFRDYVEAMLQIGRNFSLPSWVQLRNIRDSKGTRPLDPCYDPSTIWVPSSNSREAKEERMHFTPAMEQYWELKKEHFDKLLFFKMGKFYELFYIDAYICQKHCDLRWTSSDSKPHVGFPETALHAYANKLVELGYRVVVVEQMETPKELEERNRSASRGVKKDKAVKRSVNEVFTNGTLVRPDMLSDMASILMTLYFSKKDSEDLAYEIGVVCVDITTGKAELINIEEKGDQFLQVRTIVCQVQPKEIAYLPGNMPLSILRYLSSIVPSIQLTNFRDFVDSVLAINDILETFEKLNVPVPEVVNRLCNESKSLCCALSGTFRYLTTILLCDRLIMTGTFTEYDPSVSKHLIVNVGAIKDLELLQSQHGDEKNSLFGFLKHTITPGGTRLLKRWITYPLVNTDRINERLDSVKWLMDNSEKLYEFRDELRAIERSASSASRGSRKKYSQHLDFERLINRITSGVLQNKRGAVYFSNVVQRRFDEFVNSMNLFDSVLQCIIRVFGDENIRKDMPKLLTALTGIKDESSEGFLENIFATTERLRSLVTLDSNGKDWIPVPGNCKEYDDLLESINETKLCFDEELKRISKQMNTTAISFVNNKYRYEVECPESIPKSRFPDSAEITSSKKGYVRFHTEEIKQLVYDLEYKEEQLQKSLFPYLHLMCKEFHSELSSFMGISDSISQLDVLSSLALVSLDTSDGPFCKPVFLSKEETNGLPMLELKESRHPVVAKLKANYIPNDILLNGGSSPAPCSLVTGPNMGGKSTILRQTCISVIMAQIGCYVPALECRLTAVDKIFTRIGAYDLIIEGKSTFLVELEETADILNHSSEDSLVIIDELGRGTSTFDGTAISIATLEYISRVIKCRCLFSTHLHLLCDEFSNDTKVLPFHMDLKLNNETRSITFLYKFISGICPKSYGMNVAQLAGIPQEVIDNSVALAKDVEFSTLLLKKISETKKLLMDVLSQDNFSKIQEFFKNNNKSILNCLESLS
ncbi:DNA mismatch repair proteins mutS family domain containing protein [Cryptosporidium tyzzeri]|nr:DNA mismatch repair proteins mutS family domain containing protein [Cryptosporidium tyzzeri]